MSVPLYPPTADTLAALPAGKAPVLVVGIVGSSSCASSLLAERISDARTFCGRGAAGRAPGSDGGTDGSTADVEFHHDAPRGMIYVHIAADLAMHAAEARAELMGLEGRDAEGVHAWLIYRSHRRIRALLLAFHVCDVLVLASNATCADFGMLRDLRLLHSLKQSAVPALSAAHRAASPTALKPPKPTVPVLGLLFGAPRAAGAADAEACAEKLEAALDAQLRKLLTSSKALARCSAAGTSALFVLPSATCAHVQRPVLALMPSDASVDAAPELHPVDDVAPLVRTAHLQAALMAARQLQEVVGLEDHVVEFEEAERLFAVQTLFHAFEAEHPVDREVAAVITEKGDVFEFVQPVRVVDHDGVGRAIAEIQELFEDAFDTVHVGLNVGVAQQPALFVLA